jgi:peptide/nickel transport system permease protein
LSTGVGSSDLLHAAQGDVPDQGEIAARSPLQLFWRRLRRDRVAMVSLAAIVVLVVIAVAAPLIVRVTGAADPRAQDYRALSLFGAATGPSAQYWFGVDNLGRDVFSRTVYGARVSLYVAFIATGLAVAFGLLVGLLAGYYRGWVDSVLARFTDVVLAFPILLLGLGLAAACSGADGCLGGLVQPGLPVVIMVIAIINWTYIARIVRGQVLSLREKEFVEAARAVGASDRQIIVREILPNLVAPLIVYSSLLIPANILLEAALSFLGLGVPPPMPTWGGMLSGSGRTFMFQGPWLVLAPGLCLTAVVFCTNMFGDALRDLLDPRLKHAS